MVVLGYSPASGRLDKSGPSVDKIPQEVLKTLSSGGPRVVGTISFLCHPVPPHKSLRVLPSNGQGWETSGRHGWPDTFDSALGPFTNANSETDECNCNDFEQIISHHFPGISGIYVRC